MSFRNRMFAALFSVLVLALGLLAPTQAAQASSVPLNVNLFDGYNYTGSRWYFDPAVYWNAAGNPTPWEQCKPLTGSENNRASSIDNASGFGMEFHESTDCSFNGDWFNLVAYHADPNLGVGQNMDNTVSSVLMYWDGN